MKKIFLSVLSAFLAVALLTGCAPQPTVSTDAPVTTTAAPETTTATAEETTATASTMAATTTTAAPTTTTKTKVTTTTSTTKKTTKATTQQVAEYAIRFEKDTSVGWECIYLNNKPDENGFSEPDSAYIVDGQAKIHLNGKWVSLKKALKSDPLVLTKAFYKAQHYTAKKSTAPKNFVDCRQLNGPGFSYAEFDDYKVGYWYIWDECPLHPYTKTDEEERTAFRKAHPSFRKTVFIVCPSDYSMALENLDICFENFGTTTTTKPTTTTTQKLSKEYSIQFEKDTSVGWKRLHKDTETTEHGDIIVTGSYIVDGNAKVYVKGKWISIRRAIKNDPNVMEKIWNKAQRDNAARSTGNAYPKNFITMRQYRGDGVNYAQYSDYTLIYCTGGGDNPSITPCPVHEYPGIGDRKWEDLSEKEQQEYIKILREYEHSHNVRWYMILPPNVPIPTWDDICEKGICYMDF